MEILVTTITPTSFSNKMLDIARKLQKFEHLEAKPIFYHVAGKKRHGQELIFRDHESKGNYPPHITLTPTFNAKNEKDMELVLEKIVKDRKPIRIKANKIWYWESNKKRHTIILLVEHNPLLTELREGIVDEFRKYAKISPLNYFMPHFTLIYDDKDGVPDDAIEYAKHIKVDFNFEISEIVLSKRTKDSYRYLKVFKLGK